MVVDAPEVEDATAGGAGAVLRSLGNRVEGHPALLAWGGGGADGSFEGPTADVADLFLHCSGERDLFGGDRNKVALSDSAVFQACAGDGGDHALFDFGAGPADGELEELVELELGALDGTAVEVDFEDL